MSMVVCAACGTPSPAGQRFCGECATPLPRVCPNCGAAVTAMQRFCGECATPLQPADAPAAPAAPAAPTRPPRAAPPEEERRLVTALFCDLVGFTPLAERLDPEDVRDIQADYFSRMAAQVERYGGIVEKYAGDAVLALFGARVAHEDDPERAVLCALGMQAAIEPIAETARARWNAEPAIRVGINTGDVIAGVWDASGRQDVAVTGDAVNTAARIQSAAAPSEILAGAETMRLTRRRIRYGQRRELSLKGKSGTVPVWPAVGVRDDVGEHWEGRTHLAPLVGRNRELAQLLAAWDRAEEGEGGLITIVGEPGVGKSRLVAETVERLAVSPVTRLLRARCLSYGQEISLWLVADLLRSLFGAHEGDAPAAIRTALEMVIPMLLPETDEDTRAEALDVLGEVLGLPAGGSLVAQAGPEIRRHALVRALHLLLAALAGRGPVAVIAEDLHWIDEASQEVMREILAGVPGSRILVLATARPGWSASWSEWGWPERIALRPLHGAEAALLAGAVLGGAPLAPELEVYVAERAGGNPFFVEELLHALEEAGGLIERDGRMHLAPGAGERLPSTLTEIILARLDRLEAQVRQVAQVGSVIGRSFAVRLLERVMGREQAALELPLAALQEAEIAFPRGAVDPEYVFKHVTLREVAYNTLVARRRKELHRQTARAIAALYPADEYAEMIAYHYARTDEPEAVEWLEKAGDRAAGMFGNETAAAHYRQAIERVEGDAAATARLQAKLGEVLYTAGRFDDAVQILDEAIIHLRQARDLEGAGRAAALLGRVHRFRGTPEEGIALVTPMIELLDRGGPSPALASLHVALAHLYFLLGRNTEMLAAAQRGSELAGAIGELPEGPRLLSEAEMRRGTALLLLGRIEEGKEVLEAALPLVESKGDLFTLMTVLGNLGVAASFQGALEQRRRYAERALTLAERMGNPARIGYALSALGGSLIELGEWGEARRLLQRALALRRDAGRAPDINWALLVLGELAIREGKWQEASKVLREGLAIAEETGYRGQLEEAHARLAELATLQGRPEEAIARLAPLAADEQGLSGLSAILPTLSLAYIATGDERDLQRAEDTIERAVTEFSDQPGVLVESLWVKGMLLVRQGRLEEAERVLDQGLAIARSTPYPYVEARLLVQQATLLTARGETEEARQRRDEALAIFRRLGARTDVEMLEGKKLPLQ